MAPRSGTKKWHQGVAPRSGTRLQCNKRNEVFVQSIEKYCLPKNKQALTSIYKSLCIIIWEGEHDTVHKYEHTHTHTHMYTYTQNTHTRTHMRAHTQHTHTHTRTHMYTRTHMRAHTQHTHTHTRTHMYTRTHTQTMIRHTHTNTNNDQTQRKLYKSDGAFQPSLMLQYLPILKALINHACIFEVWYEKW